MVPQSQKRECTLPRLLKLLPLVLLIAASPAWAKEHPVPLEKNVDAAKCLECHEDKTKGKAVHSAIATGCLSCHEVRVNKDITRIKLTMPNLHHLLADLSPFGQDNPNHIFVPIDEPHGYIEATVER